MTAMLICVCTAPNVHADETINSKNNIFITHSQEDIGIYSVNYGCSNCGGGLCYTACVKSMLPSTSDDGYHNSTCYVTHYKSYAKVVCPNCGWNDWYKVGGVNARHYCIEKHSKCSKGTYNVCPIGIYF